MALHLEVSTKNGGGSPIAAWFFSGKNPIEKIFIHPSHGIPCFAGPPSSAMLHQSLPPPSLDKTWEGRHYHCSLLMFMARRRHRNHHKKKKTIREQKDHGKPSDFWTQMEFYKYQWWNIHEDGRRAWLIILHVMGPQSRANWVSYPPFLDQAKRTCHVEKCLLSDILR